MATETVGIVFTAQGLSQILSQTRDLKNELSSLKSQRIDLLGNNEQIRHDLAAAIQKLNELKYAKQEAANVSGTKSEEYKTAAANYDAAKKAVDDLRVSLQASNLELGANAKAIEATNIELREGAAAARDYATAIEAIGGAISALGSVSGFIGDMSAGIANAFQSMGNMFGNESVTDTLTRLATYGVTQMFKGNLQNAVSRYDILHTFAPYMNAAGVETPAANMALSRVNESILGIPIGLDEAAQRLRRYQMFLDDIEASTNLTIGVQSAIIAGGASEQMQTQAYYQIDRLLSAGKLNTSRQWLSLIQGLGVSMRFVSEQMGVTGMNAKELAAGLTSGEISTEEFLNALMELGKGESVAAQGLNSLLDIYRTTVEAWLKNIEYATTRGQANVLDTLGKTLETYTGEGLTGYLKEYRDFINATYKGINSYITDNPQQTVNMVNSLRQLIDTFAGINFSELATGVFNRLGEGVDLISRAMSHIPDGALERFASFAVTLAGPIGAGMAASSGLGQLLGIFERFERFDFGNLIDDIAREVERMMTLVSTLLDLIPDGLMSDLMAFGLVWGKPVATALQAIGSALSSVAVAATSATVSGAFAEGGVLAVLVQIGLAAPELLAAAGAIAAIGAALVYYNHEVNTQANALKDSLGLTGMDQTLREADTLIASIERNSQARQENAAMMERQAAEAEELRQHILDLNGQDLDAGGMADLEISVARLNEIMPTAAASIDEATGHLTAQSAAALEDAAAFEQLILQMKATAQQGALLGIISEGVNLDIQRQSLLQDFYRAQTIKTELGDELYKAKMDPSLGIFNPELDAKQKAYDEAAARVEELRKALIENKDARAANTKELNIAEKAYKDTSAAMKDHESDITAQTEALEDLKTAALELAGANLSQTLREIGEGVDKSAAGFEKWELPKPVGQGGEGVLTQDIENMETEAAFYNTASKNLDRVREYLFESWDKLTVPEGVDSTGLRTNLINYINEVLGTDDEETAAQKINNVLAAFDELDWDTLLRLGEGKGATDEATQNFKDSVEALAQAAEEANDAAERANTSLETLPELLNEIKEKQEEASKALQEALQGSSFEEQEGSWFERVGSSVQGKFDAAKGVLSEYADSLSQMVAAYQTNAAELEISALSMQASMQQVQEASEEASKEVPQNTEKMSSEVSQNMSTMASNTETSVNDTITSVNKLAPAISAQIPLVTAAALNLGTGLAQGLQAGVSAAQNAASQIAAAAASITAAVQQAASAAAGLGTGGGGEVSGEAITLATGGSVFSPFGSDIVPAMLTPGEYIIRKGAADFFGRGLLERINALDIGGAFDRLILNSPVTAGRFGGNVYNKDNHASVVQNYYNSSPDYGNRRAWRFAHSL